MENEGKKGSRRASGKASEDVRWGNQGRRAGERSALVALLTALLLMALSIFCTLLRRLNRQVAAASELQHKGAGGRMRRSGRWRQPK